LSLNFLKHHPFEPFLKGDTFRTSTILWCGKVCGTREGFPEYDEEKMPEFNIFDQGCYNEKTFGENVPIPSDPKVIELKQSIFPPEVYDFNFEENKKYRVDVNYKSRCTIGGDNRFIDIQSNLFSFEFVHKVFNLNFSNYNILLLINFTLKLIEEISVLKLNDQVETIN